MKNRTLLLELLCFVLFSACTTTRQYTDTAVRDIPADVMGMVHAGRTETAEEYHILNEMGVSWLLNTFYWNSIETKRGEWDFSSYDSFVENGKKAGKKIIAVLAYATDWLFTEGLQKETKTKRYISPENIPLFLDFVEKTVERYRDSVDAWQIWNEPNWVFWDGSDAEFCALTIAVVQKIRSIAPHAYIIAGGFSGTPEDFIQTMAQAGAFQHVDAISFHPYALTPYHSVRLYDQLTRLLNRINFNGSIWVTEVGYPTSGNYPHVISEEKMPEYVVKTLIGLIIRGPKVVLWYELYDRYNRGEAPLPHNSEDFFGLFYPDNTGKLGSYAYALVAHFVADSEFVPGLPRRVNVPSSLSSFYFRRRDGLNVLFLWNDGTFDQTVRLTLSGDATVYNIVTNSQENIQRTEKITVGTVPCILTWHDSVEYTHPRIDGTR
ncbi:beta-galactosidase [Pillotina sp. SPG140]|jgi:hypothetical protein